MLMRLAARIVAFALAVASLYAVAWGLIYVTADRSGYILQTDPDGTVRSWPPGVPFPSVFPDPGIDTEPLAATFMAIGAIGLGLSILIAVRARRIGRTSRTV